MKYPFLCFILAFVMVGISNQQANGQENYEIRKINFHGNKSLNKDFLLGKMTLREVSLPEKILTKSEPTLYNQELLRSSLERLKRIYQSEGFLFAETGLDSLVMNDKNQTVRLNFKVKEGEPIRIDTVLFEFAEIPDNLNTDSLKTILSKQIQLKPGKRFRDKGLIADQGLIREFFQNRGYAYVTADYKLNLLPENHITGITYIVTTGPVCQIGETTISGLNHVSGSFVKKQLEYEQGNIYKNSLLNDTRERLYQLQLFRIVSVLPSKNPATQKSPIPVKINIEEAPRISTRFGAGYGTEDKFRAFLDLNYFGFLGGARRINLYLKHSARVPYSASLRWIQPQLFDAKSSVSLNPFISRNTEPGYDTRTFGLNVPFSYRFNPRLSSTLTYYLEDVQQTVEKGDTEFQDMESSKFPYNKSGVLFSTVFDNSQPQFSPFRGLKISGGVKLNGYIFGSKFSYTRIWTDVRKYQKIGNTTLALRIMAGGISSGDSSKFIPVEDRFYSGGSHSNRGWSLSELGPKRESGTPSGGKSIFETNAELRFPVIWKIKGVVFMDGGNIWKNSFQYKLNELEYSIGAGIRIQTPIGPVRFDAGWPVWNEKKSPQFFLSVGQAF